MSFTLYHFPSSICSIMVRYTLAVRGPPKNENSTMAVTEKIVDIVHDEQLTEEFLCDINPKGQVPVLASASLSETIPDSMAITRFICDRYPQLVPESHQSEIAGLLNQLHQINYFSLTFSGKQNMLQHLNDGLNKRLGAPDISDHYRKALEFKISVNNKEKAAGLQEGTPEQNAACANELLSTCAELLQPAEGPWLWGRQQPTALDAHLVVFIARLTDIGRGSLVPPELKAYADQAMASDEWDAVMRGRSTTASLN